MKMCILLAFSLCVVQWSTRAMGQPRQPDDVQEVGAVCSGLEVIQAKGGSGTISSHGFEFKVDKGESLIISRSGSLFRKIKNFTASDYVNCVTELERTIHPDQTPRYAPIIDGHVIKVVNTGGVAYNVSYSTVGDVAIGLQDCRTKAPQTSRRFLVPYLPAFMSPDNSSIVIDVSQITYFFESNKELLHSFRYKGLCLSPDPTFFIVEKIGFSNYTGAHLSQAFYIMANGFTHGTPHIVPFEMSDNWWQGAVFFATRLPSIALRPGLDSKDLEAQFDQQPGHQTN